jgi:hypothetical protein
LLNQIGGGIYQLNREIMEQQYSEKPNLNQLENLELAGITFIRDYIQFLFDGPLLNTYTLPHIKIHGKVLASTDYGYYDTMCSLIGKTIISTHEDQEDEKLTIKFENEFELFVSLKLEDRDCVEAAMLRIVPDGEWKIW